MRKELSFALIRKNLLIIECAIKGVVTPKPSGEALSNCLLIADWVLVDRKL